MATGVSASTSVAATFNEAIASGLSFVLTTASGSVAATFSSSAATATLVPSAPLQASTVYTATVSGVKDATGHVMAAPFSWSFTTAAVSSSASFVKTDTNHGSRSTARLNSSPTPSTAPRPKPALTSFSGNWPSSTARSRPSRSGSSTALG
jgi:hypothetical protein